MKEIVARDQVRLGLVRCFRLALAGMNHRLFRSSVTVAILALAVAFLTHMLGFGILERETRAVARAELEASRRLGQSIVRLGAADSRAVIFAALSRGDAARLAEYQAFSGASREVLSRAGKSAERYLSFARYLDELPDASRAVILGDAKGYELLESWSGPEQARGAAGRLVSLGHGRGGELVRLIAERQAELDPIARAIEAGQRRAIERLGARFGGKPVAELAADPPPDFVARASEQGFVLPELAALRAFARRARDQSELERALLSEEARARISRESQLGPAEVSLPSVLDYVGGSAERAERVATALRAGGAPARLDGPRVLELLERFERERKLERLSGDPFAGLEPVGGGTPFGLPERTLWLIALSFLVCVVGVANAMLMSVTERFSEIATMKCLGAMDGFVMAMFVFEALIQGAVGGLCGALLGVVLAWLRTLLEYGALAGSALAAAGEVGLAALLSLVVGVLLAALAAVGPSFVAARLAPMEAMRVD